MMIQYFIWLSELKGITAKDKRGLLNYFGTPKRVFEASKTEVPEQYWAITHRILDKDLRAADEILIESHKKNIKTLTIDDPLYREDARMLGNAPLILYYKGEIKGGKSKTIAIVGTRNATEYGKVAAQLICLECLEKDVAVWCQTPNTTECPVTQCS